jgi:hypothetical protein
MAPETTAQAADESLETHRPGRRRPGSNLLIGAALIVSAAAGSLWVTDAGARVATAGTSSAARSIATPAPAATPAIAGAGILPVLSLPAGPANTLLSGDGTLDTTVTTYADCTGATELTHSTAAIDTCVNGRIYFVGHNAGVFTPLLDLGVGSAITWYDSGGAAHLLRIVAVRDNWLRDDGVPPLANGRVVAQFQTCETAYPDGSHDRILDAVPA